MSNDAVSEVGNFAIVGDSAPVRRLLDKIRRVAQVPRPVMILGERGTGKELVARALHSASELAGPMVTVNCAAFSDSLLESELFGHERGAFTGAERVRAGKFELAHDGMLFLDEISNMSIAFQRKILRVVEYGSFVRVGGTEERRTNARVISASNRNPKELIRRGEFLADLYDRLSFEVIEVPPLRRRLADLRMLASHFLQQFAREIPDFGGKVLAESTIQMLRSYDFPGNVRELKNIIERAAYRDTTNEITPVDIGLLASEKVISRGSFKDKCAAFEKSLLDDALSQAKGNQAQAARLLGLSYHQLRHYLKKHSL